MAAFRSLGMLTLYSRSRLLHLLRHFYLGVNGLGYSSLFRLWDYCRMPVFLSK